jgi:hypothetical protein
MRTGPALICEPGPGCPPIGREIEPDPGTLDALAVATGGSVRRLNVREKVDWHQVLAAMRNPQSPRSGKAEALLDSAQSIT